MRVTGEGEPSEDVPKVQDDEGDRDAKVAMAGMQCLLPSYCHSATARETSSGTPAPPRACAIDFGRLSLDGPEWCVVGFWSR